MIDVQGQKVVWFVSSGGHLSQALRWNKRLDTHPESLWVTPRTAQAEFALSNQRVRWVPQVKPRDAVGSARVAWEARKILGQEKFDACVSTGAGLAVGALAVAASRGIRTIFIDSLTRSEAPSLSGRMLARHPHIELYTQHPTLADSRWSLVESLLAGYQSTQRDVPLDEGPALITLGTLESHPFDRAVVACEEILSPHPDTLWQIGPARVLPSWGEVERYVSPQRLSAVAKKSQLVFCHAGVGSVLDALDSGAFPILLPRSPEFGEHVDNHQESFAREISRRNLGVVWNFGHTNREAIKAALERQVTRLSIS